MCGIYLTNIPYEKEEVKEKLESISYRGPDFMGIKKAGDLTFGHLRLSILDLDTRSNQPMIVDHLTIVFIFAALVLVSYFNQLKNISFMVFPKAEIKGIRIHENEHTFLRSSSSFDICSFSKFRDF